MYLLWFCYLCCVLGYRFVNQTKRVGMYLIFFFFLHPHNINKYLCVRIYVVILNRILKIFFIHTNTGFNTHLNIKSFVEMTGGEMKIMSLWYILSYIYLYTYKHRITLKYVSKHYWNCYIIMLYNVKYVLLVADYMRMRHGRRVFFACDRF